MFIHIYIWNAIGDEGATKISELLMRNNSLQRLGLSGEIIERTNNSDNRKWMIYCVWKGNGIGEEGATRISEALMVNTTLTNMGLES